ncbi:putative leucine-rich repeat-containing protein DDB_G0290503 [Pararge aegeria]|uniref:putative leucine-rich repeat-containing protein DDB_G0290503 n=1 Tax=Pararge aegeria TaxID=116150 RepID=UPI0019D1D960|nr:putative leucine-rich repeat-containing protein DDB_G0290503 [Pararge aegeria]
MSGEPKNQEPSSAVEYHHKCRIPQRLAPGRQRPPKSKAPSVDAKNKVDVVTSHQPSNGVVRCKTRPNSSESRPKSVSRATNEVGEPADFAATTLASRSSRPERDRCSMTQKKPAKRALNEKFHDTSLNIKAGRQIITVPLKQKTKATYHNKMSSNLPDQETIKKYEDLELQQEDFSDAAHMYNSVNDIFMDFNEDESIPSQSDKILQLQNSWQEKIVQFEEMKSELNDRQNEILEVYASLRNAKQKLMSMGHETELPTTDDLRIMNVANMSANQLLQLCAESKSRRDDNLTKNSVVIDLKKFNEIPLKLVATCEQTIATRKDMIDWFEKLKNQEQGCPKSSLSKKINEFNAESEMLSCTLTTVKNEFLNELNDILRSCLNERVALQLRIEEFTYEVSELNSQNADLKKQLYNAEKQKTHINKKIIEELEKELKDEKFKKMRIRDHLSRAEGQVKIEAERSSLLEAALNQTRSQTRILERTVQQLHEQNKQLQKDFGDELNKLKATMKTNTTHLEEIATARQTLQNEKEDLKKKLEELSFHYNESLATMKEDLNKNVGKLIDVEKKYNDEIEEKKKLHRTIESQCAHLLEYELSHKEILKKCQQTERNSNEFIHYKEDYERTKHELDETNANLEKHKKLILEQDKKIMEIEGNLKISYELENKIKGEIANKEDYIATLELKHALLQQQYLESERKMQVYEDQLTTLKNHLSNLQEHFIEFENLNELRDLVNRQNIKLAETRRKNKELSEELEKKQNNLKELVESVTELEGLIDQKQSVLQKLSEQKEEQSSVLKLNQVICEKNAEINSLIKNIEARKEQISQLEKIILTMEDQNRRGAIQKRRDCDKIHALEEKIAKLNHYTSNQDSQFAGPENLDNLIKTLEDELGTPLESPLITMNHVSDCRGNENISIRNENIHEDRCYEKESNYQQNAKAMPTKRVMGNFIKKTYIPNNDDKYKNDNYFPCKEAIINKQKWISEDDAENKIAFIDNNLLYEGGSLQHRHAKGRLLKKLQYVLPTEEKGDKKCKMFKFASHRIS